MQDFNKKMIQNEIYCPNRKRNERTDAVIVGLMVIWTIVAWSLVAKMFAPYVAAMLAQ